MARLLLTVGEVILQTSCRHVFLEEASFLPSPWEFLNILQSGTKLKGVWGESPPSHPRKFANSQGKNGSTCISAGQLSGPRTIGQLLLLIKVTNVVLS